ncbi:hypothetical protein MAM1_0373c10135 [Mucor ambiguus]|uniref:Secreted protein n=1 Tax=Mucor ambiguus TaxID=91626 RepID=A0A0C9MIC0_9FUNG|nr:hypothetical protein MAM1_0373c10135 [Mucor ambiguus]
MLLIKSLLLSFAASIHCSSIYAGARIFNIGCANPIHQELDTVQALKPNLKNHLQFGYIYSMNSPDLDVSADIPIKHPAQNNWIPSKVAAVLSGISYSESSSKLILTSRISKNNANKLDLASLDSVNIEFGTFGYDKSKKEWHSSLKTGNLGGIQGKVTKSKIVHQQDGGNSHHELVMEMVPLKNDDQVQYLSYAHDGVSSDLRMKWDSLARNQCSKVTKNNSFSNRRDHFNEIIESAVLL